jgi:RsiW-degrading membrane proteinase PrsW (M82 family)
MTHAHLLELAQQGDPSAIAILLNQALNSRGVVVKVRQQEGCLYLLLVASRPLNAQNLTLFLQTQLSKINFHDGAVSQVKVYSYQTGKERPDWEQEFVPILQGRSPNSTERTLQYRPIGQAFFSALTTLRFSAIFPYQDVLSRDLYKSYTVRLLLFLGLFPLIVDLISSPDNLAQTAWLLGIYYATIWGVVLHDLIKPSQFSWGEVLRCVLFTTFVGVPLLLFIQRVPPFSALYAAIDQGIVLQLLGFVLGVGVLEETCKALPVYFFLLKANRLRDPLTSAFYGAMSGLGFAIAEGVTYSFLYGSGLSHGDLGLSEYIAVNTVRFVSLPLFHAILAGTVGYFIGLAALNPTRQWPIMFIGLAIAATIHGLYNTFSGSIAGILMIAFSILLFVTYLRRSEQIVAEIRRSEAAAEAEEHD